MMYATRMLLHEDIPAIAEMTKYQHASSSYAHMRYDPEQVHKLLIAMIRLSNYGGIVLLRDTVVAGYAGMTLEPYLFSDATMAKELCVYVDLQYRSMLAFQTLLSGMEAWARSKGACTLDLSLTAPSDMNLLYRIGNLYQRCGLTCVGEIYRKEIK